MNKKALRVLEFNKIIDLLKDKASSSLGLKYIDKLTPSSNFEDVKYMLEETSEAQSILLKNGGTGLQGIHDIEDKVKRAHIGASLDPASLIMIADTLRAARTIKNKLSSSEEENFNYPIIQALSNSLYAYRDIEDAIYNAIVSEVEISDNASSTLRDIRRRIVQKNQSIRSKLNSIISSTTYQKYLQDAIISVRGDRFVVPVKAEYRSQVSGIVHDQSSSGATLFIEPMSIVDMNNELRQLRLKEKEEIERILQELSAMVGEVSEDLIANQEILGRLDFAFAKGKLSIQMRGVEPKLNEDKYINIKNGRHPLLDKDKVVPNSVYLVFKPQESGLPIETNHLSVGMYGSSVDFFVLKGVIENILNAAGLKGYEIEPETTNTTFHPGRCAKVVYNNICLGIFGELHPNVIENYNLGQRVYVAEIDTDLVFENSDLSKTYTPLPKYPSTSRDIALIVKDEIFVKQIEDIIKANSCGLVESYKLFDVYKGSQIEEGYKSIAYSITYRSAEKTLTDEDVAKVHDKILSELSEKLNANLRSN